MKPTIEAMTATHIDQIYSIETQSFKTPWPRDFFVDEVTNPDSISFVAIIAGAVAGYLCCRHIIDEAHIGNIAVSPQFRRLGVADALLLHLESVARAVKITALTLEVAEGNIAAQNLYKKHGYIIEGTRKNYYPDIGQDAFIMWKYFEAEVAYEKTCVSRT